MKFLPYFIITTTAAILVSSCDSDNKGKHAASTTPEETGGRADVPMLPVTKGDTWIYEVSLEIPENITSEGASEVKTKHTRTRTYLGKVSAAQGLPETDCFEVDVPGSPKEREFVEIHDDRILMRGSLILRPETSRPMWLDPPVPFVIAGMKPGTAMPELKTGNGVLSRRTQVIAREDIRVPAGNFQCIRILTIGNDGDIELRLTRWFSPGNGIIREEKIRYRAGKLIYRESQELKELLRARS
jgi:hypothetical protein